MRLLLVGKYATLFATVAVGGWFAVASGFTSPAENAITNDTRRPILLELFTSEGCSSCPPADRLLETLDRTQPVPGADLIVLSEHVDYWNRLGWTDPYSGPLFTQRQQDYIRRFRLDGAYTPQLVIDGRADAVGNDERAVRAGILKAEAGAKTAIALRAQRSGPDVKVSLEVDRVTRPAEIYLALADDHAQSQVTRGENSGHMLRHVAVVRSLALVGTSNAQGAFTKELTLPWKGGNSGPRRAVAFLQDSETRRILGAAETRF